jgi:hypothetical protein
MEVATMFEMDIPEEFLNLDEDMLAEMIEDPDGHGLTEEDVENLNWLQENM